MTPSDNGDASRRHALRNSLNHILGYTDLLIEEAPERSPAEIIADLQKIQSAGREMLALLEGEPVPPPPSSAAAPLVLDTGSILVVDDDADNREVLSRSLQSVGYTVTEATSGEEAMAFLRSAEFDLVLCDVVMPGVSGIEVLQHIRSVFADALPVVMLSGVDQLDIVVTCLELGADDYLSKPFEPAILRARARASIERKRLRQREMELSQELTGRYVL